MLFAIYSSHFLMEHLQALLLALFAFALNEVLARAARQVYDDGASR